MKRLITTHLSAAILLGMTATHPVSASTPLTASLYPLAGEQLTPFSQSNVLFYLVTSESSGLTVADANNNIVATLGGHYSQTDIIAQNGNNWLIAALNTNTLGVELLRYHTESKRFTLLGTLPAKEADIESVCISIERNHPVITTSDAQGMIHQDLFYQQTFSSIRSLTAGKGIAACQVNPASSSLLFADENVGLWRYSHNWLAKGDRELSRPSGVEGFKSVGVTHNGLTLAVSPEVSVLWILSSNGFSNYSLAADLEPESVRATVMDNTLIVGLFDDASKKLFTVSLPAPVPEKVEETMPPDEELLAVGQTDPVQRYGDAADDPAIWYFKDNPDNTVILGTDKKAGLDLYNLAGKRIQHLPVGRLNNVDVRSRWVTDSGTMGIAAASNRSTGTVDIFTLDKHTQRATPSTKLKSNLNDLYGLCMYQSEQDLDVLVNDKDGHFERHRLTMADGKITGKVIDTFTIPTQPEGCVADDEAGMLYYGEEDVGIWARSLEGNPNEKIIARVNQRVRDDIEGIALFSVEGKKYIIASSQGNDRYAVYGTGKNYPLLGTFNIGPNLPLGIDGTAETDGLDAISLPVGSAYPDGILIVQDGFNVMPSDKQNFKFVQGTDLANFIRQRR